MAEEHKKPKDEKPAKPKTSTESELNKSELNKSEIENPKSEMEVQHHPDIEKKGLKEYILEGLMIFMAVTLGFFAEGLREHISDRAKEMEYVVSLKQDLQHDTANLAQ